MRWPEMDTKKQGGQKIVLVKKNGDTKFYI